MTISKDKQLIFNVTKETFEQTVIRASHEAPVIVDFWADWCGPCRMLAPLLEKDIEAHGGKVLLAKINTDEESELSAKFEIRGIPAVKAFYQGQVVDEFVGLPRNPAVITQFVQRLADKVKL